MNIAYTVIVLYLVIGIIVLCIFDWVTKRISTKLDNAAAETQSQLGAAGAPMRHRTAKIVFLIVMWIFWPVVLVGAVMDKKEKKSES